VYQKCWLALEIKMVQPAQEFEALNLEMGFGLVIGLGGLSYFHPLGKFNDIVSVKYGVNKCQE